MRAYEKKGSELGQRLMLGASLAMVILLVIGLVISTPARAADSMSSAEKLRRLDIMLMVTGLRCRTTSDSFTSDYGRFTRRHMSTLQGANRQLRSELAQRHGGRGAKRAMDRLSVTMANDFGQGHPWLSCGQLKQVTRNLSQVDGKSALISAADQILARRRSSHFAYAAP